MFKIRLGPPHPISQCPGSRASSTSNSSCLLIHTLEDQGLMAQVFELLPPVLEYQLEFLATGLWLAQPRLLQAFGV